MYRHSICRIRTNSFVLWYVCTLYFLRFTLYFVLLYCFFYTFTPSPPRLIDIQFISGQDLELSWLMKVNYFSSFYLRCRFRLVVVAADIPLSSVLVSRPLTSSPDLLPRDLQSLTNLSTKQLYLYFAK